MEITFLLPVKINIDFFKYLFHAADCVKRGQKKIQIRTVDTYVGVLEISVVDKIKVEKLWVASGTGKHFRHTAAHAIVLSLGADKSRTLPAFHAVSDCDTVSFFGLNGNLKA